MNKLHICFINTPEYWKIFYSGFPRYELLCGLITERSDGFAIKGMYFNEKPQPNWCEECINHPAVQLWLLAECI